MVFPAWFDDPEEGSSYKEVHFKNFSSENVNETPANAAENTNDCNY